MYFCIPLACTPCTIGTNMRQVASAVKFPFKADLISAWPCISSERYAITDFLQNFLLSYLLGHFNVIYHGLTWKDVWMYG